MLTRCWAAVSVKGGLRMSDYLVVAEPGLAPGQNVGQTLDKARHGRAKTDRVDANQSQFPGRQRTQQAQEDGLHVLASAFLAISFRQE